MPGSSPRSGRGVVPAVKDRRLHFFYITPYKRGKRIVSYGYGLPAKAWQCKITMAGLDAATDEQQVAVAKLIACSVNAKVTVAAVMASMSK